MGESELLYQLQSSSSVDHRPRLPVRSLVPISFMDLAQEYGFERHRRVYACPIHFMDNPCPQPSFLEALLGDG